MQQDMVILKTIALSIDSRILQNDTSLSSEKFQRLTDKIRLISRFPPLSDKWFGKHRHKRESDSEILNTPTQFKAAVPALHSWVAGVSPWERGRVGRRCGGWWRRPWDRAVRRSPRRRRGWCSGTHRRRGPEGEWNRALRSAGSAAWWAASSTPPCQFGSRTDRTRERTPKSTTAPLPSWSQPWWPANPSSSSLSSSLGDHSIPFFPEANPLARLSPVLCTKFKWKEEDSVYTFIIILQFIE